MHQLKLLLVKNITLIAEVIDSRGFFSRLVTYETKALEITIESHKIIVISMSFHPQQTLSSLGHLGSFYTIYEWIGI
jgi:hypothetical protein